MDKNTNKHDIDKNTNKHDIDKNINKHDIDKNINKHDIDKNTNKKLYIRPPLFMSCETPFFLGFPKCSLPI